jgi:mannose-6-phosphate isomerase-like protein (cupin superfamily)
MSYKSGDKDRRPWGTWEVLDVGAKHAVKRIMVEPGKILSLQLHHHRDEHWIIVRGTATVTVGAETYARRENESVFIPRMTQHRIGNDTQEPMEFIEIQTGDDLREDDIVRLEDAYGRK